MNQQLLPFMEKDNPLLDELKKQLEKDMEGIGKINEMAFKVDTETLSRIKDDRDASISRGFPRLPRDR